MNHISTKAAGVILCWGYLSSLHATPSLSGFYADVAIGGVRDQFHEYIRGKENGEADQVHIINESKFGIAGMLGIGYGLSFQKGFYVGAHGVLIGDLTNIVETDIHKTFTDTQISLDGATSKTYEGSYSLSAKPLLSYGVHLQVGWRLFPNVLATLGFGLEWTSTTLLQQINTYTPDGTDGFFVTDGVFKPLKDVETTTGAKITTTTSHKCPELNIRNRHLVPSLSVKIFLSPSLFAHIDAAIRFGKFNKLSETAYNKTNVFSSTAKDSEAPATVTGGNLSSLGASLHVTPKTSLRLCFGLGWKF